MTEGVRTKKAESTQQNTHKQAAVHPVKIVGTVQYKISKVTKNQKTTISSSQS